MNAERKRESATHYDIAGRMECAECGAVFARSKFAAKTGIRAQKFCSSKCAMKSSHRAFNQRSPRKSDGRLKTAAWKVARAKAIERDKGLCRVCGKAARHVHHVLYRTEAEMHDHDQDNLMTLCNPCHNTLHDIKIGKVNGEFVISGAVFQFLGITAVKVV